MTPKAVFDRIEILIGLAGAPRLISEVIEQELAGFFGKPPLAASEHADRLRPAVTKLIWQRAALADDDGTQATLALVGSTSDSVAGACHILAMDPPEVVAAKAQRLHANALLTAIKALSFADFEKFGARVLALLGAESVHITQHGGDQGIDFFGRLSLAHLHGHASPFMRLAHDIRLSFAGQAKHYPDRNLGPDIVRELVGAVLLARSKTFSRDGLDLFEQAGFKPFSPVATLLFNTGGISSGARRLAEAAGVIVRSGEQLAMFLADHAVGLSPVEGNLVFDPVRFAQWLAG